MYILGDLSSTKAHHPVQGAAKADADAARFGGQRGGAGAVHEHPHQAEARHAASAEEEIVRLAGTADSAAVDNLMELPGAAAAAQEESGAQHMHFVQDMQACSFSTWACTRTCSCSPFPNLLFGD